MWEALLPRGLLERARDALARGWTATQVEARLPAIDRARLAGQGRPVEQVHEALLALVAAGRVTCRRERLTVSIPTQGPRDMVVDVYRAVSRPPPSSSTRRR